MKKRMIGISTLLLGGLLAGCGGESSGGSSESEGEVLVWNYFTGKQKELFDELVQEYNDSQDAVTVTSEYVPFDEIKKQLSVGSAGDTLPDMVFVDTVDNAALASQGVLANISDEVNEWGEKENFLEGPMKSAIYEEEYYGLPFASNALGLFYNEEKLEEAGFEEPPETWEELSSYSETLTTDETTGMALSGVKSEESTFQFYPFLLSNDVDYQSLDSAEASESLEVLDELIENGYMDDGVVNATQDDLARQFGTGEVAMMVNGSWNIERLKEENESLEFSIAPIPSPEGKDSVSTLGGENLALVEGGNQEESWEFMSWLLEPEQLTDFTAETSTFPAREDILNESDNWSEDKHLSQFIPILENAQPRGPSPNWPSISSPIQVAIQEAFTDSKTPEEALEDAAAKVEENTQKE
ncbi:ABC transporter substrate-binding protein [Marinococcus sp. PL1-022]|uniref:ABC transporter substrate-binding protein n=1 Tax=Marinococcus sp. PL1-022 TaxID=3095363 RepID=UPI0029C4B3A0|nr:ABC transporter substrate-binding protein [Marinococcus sp. PL1-022]MDX6152299.1 ABC transporter substrate-binding protein [Marinococcus sp. PL1-022]